MSEQESLDNIDDVNEEFSHFDFSMLNDTTTYDQYIDIIYDQEVDIDDKIKIVDKMLEKYPYRTREFVQKIMYTYIYTEISYLTKFLVKIVKESTLEFDHKIEISKTLCFMQKENDCLVTLCDQILHNHVDINALLYFDAIKTLVENEIHREKGIEHLHSFFKNTDIDIDYRYNSIFAIHVFQLDEKYKKELFLNMLCFFYNNVPYITYKILVCQYFIIHETKDPRNDNFIESLFDYARDIELDENLRADSLDVLLRCKDKSIRDRAYQCIQELGFSNRKKMSIYDNSQNVHTTAIEKSSIMMMNKLHEEVNEQKWNVYSYHDIIEYFETKNKNLDEEQKAILKKSLTRIQNDRATYTSHNLLLSNILCLIFTYIMNIDEYKEELYKRLLEELIDSNGVCSTGNAFRLINVLSGFGTYHITISYEDQFKAKFQLYLEKYCEEIEDEDFKMDILMDMTKSDISDKIAFRKFFIDAYPKIQDILKEEFKDSISEALIEEYLRFCVSFYMNH
jgi:hypothetical protein